MRELEHSHLKRRFGRAAILLGFGLVLAACSNNRDQIEFDGVSFRTKSKAVSDDRSVFSVRIPKIDKGLAQARKAGRHEGTRYCLTNFGTSEIAWATDPDADQSQLNINGSTLMLQGKCVTW